MRRTGIVALALPAILVLSSCALGQATEATKVQGTKAVLNGNISAVENGPVEHWFQYGTTTAYGTETEHRSTPVSDHDDHPVSEAISGLSFETEYHFRLCAKNAGQGNPNCGGDQTFTTLDRNWDTVSVDEDGVLRFVSGENVPAVLHVARVDPQEGPPYLRFADEWGSDGNDEDGSFIDPGPGCDYGGGPEYPDLVQDLAYCELAGITSIDIELGDRDDNALIGGPVAAGDPEITLPVRMDGGTGGDELVGSTGPNAGAATLVGGEGDDYLVGGGAGDHLEGGPGIDTFLGQLGGDTIDAVDGAADERIDCGNDGANTFPPDPAEPDDTANIDAVDQSALTLYLPYPFPGGCEVLNLGP